MSPKNLALIRRHPDQMRAARAVEGKARARADTMR
jgi:hypothetical protein